MPGIVWTLIAFLGATSMHPDVANAGPRKPPPEAVQRFDIGYEAYERGEYEEAARAWEASLEIVPAKGFAAARASLLLDISTAHERTFDTTGDTKSLERARIYLAAYSDAIDDAHDDPEAREREHARVRDREARIERKQNPPPVVAITTPVAPIVHAPAPLTGEPAEAPQHDTRDRVRTKHRAMIAGGTVLTLAGVGGLAMLGAGVMQENTALSISGLVVALAGGVVGPVMIVFAVRRRKAALSSGRTTVQFHGDPRFAGFSFARRF
jgi:tetratricopeptide (TPR) repeat protein